MQHLDRHAVVEIVPRKFRLQRVPDFHLGAAPHPGALAPLIRKIDEALVGLITGHPDAELGRDAP
jgi:hypothetical protein